MSTDMTIEQVASASQNDASALFSSDFDYANRLLNLTPHDLHVQTMDGEATLVLPASGTELRLHSADQLFLESLACQVHDDDADDDDDCHRRQTLAVYEPQRFDGFEPMAPIEHRHSCPGIVVPMIVGLYVESLSKAERDKLLPHEQPTLPVYGVDTGSERLVRFNFRF